MVVLRRVLLSAIGVVLLDIGSVSSAGAMATSFSQLSGVEKELLLDKGRVEEEILGKEGIEEKFVERSLTKQQPTKQQPTRQQTPEDEAELQRAEVLNGRVIELYRQERYEEAIAIAQEVLSIQESVHGEVHSDVASALTILFLLHQFNGDDEMALTFGERVLEIQEATLSIDAPKVVDTLDNLVNIYQRQNRYAEALPLALRLLSIARTTSEESVSEDTGENEAEEITSKLADRLVTVGTLYHQLGQYAESISVVTELIAIREAELGESHPTVALYRSFLAKTYQQNGDSATALRLMEQALSAQEEALGINDPEVATTLNNLVEIHRSQGRYVEALPLAERALTITKNAYGESHPSVARSLLSLGNVYLSLARYAEAIQLQERALALYEAKQDEAEQDEAEHGAKHIDVAVTLTSLTSAYDAVGDYAAAMSSAQRALATYKEILDEDHPTVATALNNLALMHVTIGEYEAALPLYERAIAIEEATFGSDNSRLVATLSNMAALYESQGDYTEAIRLFERTLAILVDTFGENHPRVATMLNNLGVVHSGNGDYETALAMHQRSLAIKETLFEENHPEIASSLGNLALVQENRANYAEALALALRALEINEQALGPEHPTVAVDLNNIGLNYSAQGQYAKALEMHERALAIRRKVFGETHPDVAASLSNLAFVYETIGDYSKAVAFFDQILAINEGAFGPDHPSVAQTLSSMAALQVRRGDYETAVNLAQQSLDLRERLFDENHPDIASSLEILAGVYRVQARYAEAMSLYERALAIHKEIFDEAHPTVASSLQNIAGLYDSQGEYSKAISLVEQSIDILEQALGPTHPDVAAGFTMLAQIYEEQGNDDAARRLYEQALAIVESTLGANHTRIAGILGGLSILEANQRNYSQAQALQEKALSIYQTAFGESHPRVATALSNLAITYYNQQNIEKALELHQQVITINEQFFGTDHPKIAGNLHNLAYLYVAERRYGAAQPLFERSLNIRERTLGENHPFVAESLGGLAELNVFQKNYEQALSFYERALAIEERAVVDTISAASESRIQKYLQQQSTVVDRSVALSFKDHRKQAQADRIALSAILQRKGRVLDAAANHLQSVRSQLTPADQDLFDQLNTTKSAISRLQFEGPGDRLIEDYQKDLARLEAQAESIESQLVSSSREFSSQITLPITVESVQSKIPQDAALVEFVRYYDFNEEAFESWREPIDLILPHRYAAYVVVEGEIHAVDLGPASEIDALVFEFQSALSTRGATVSAIARQLDEKLMAPLRPALLGKQHLLLSPDSNLNLIPFDALQDEQGDYLLENYQTSYLSSGRDLLKLETAAASQQPPLVMANPDYGSGGRSEVASAQNANSRSVDISGLSFLPLPGTAAEVDAIAPLLPNAIVLTQSQATEAALKAVQGPSILHIATHGFFLPDVEFVPASSSRGASLQVVNTDPQPTQVSASNLENPLLRSGLALANANSRISGEEDGIFTALEASGLDLYGTQLVVLSACETGLGAVENGEGVYGLRRTFAIAGAQSQLMSLWQVDDAGTSELMQSYYQNLVKKKQGRSEALRNAQLEMMNTGTYTHPYYWSSFIFSGDWRALEQ